MTRIAILGGGAAGLSAARTLLQAGAEVLLFEAAPRLGGNCVGVEVRSAEGHRFAIDAGVSDFNRATFTEFAQALDELGLATHPIGTDASFATADGCTVASCRGGTWRCDPAFAGADRLGDDVAAFRRRAPEALHERFAGWTLGRWLDHVGASAALREVCVLPRAAGAFPMPDRRPEDMPLRGIIEFWRMHGVVGELPADRRCVTGGMHRYPAAFARWFAAHRGELCCGTRVLGVARERTHVALAVVGPDDRHRRVVVDHVLFANHAHDALPLLANASAAEVRVLGAFARQRARVVVHHDERLVGDDRASWGAFHYVLPRGGPVRVRPTITFFPNRLAGLPAAAPDTFVTMNPHVEPRPERIVAERWFVHPVAGEAHAAAAAALEARQGQQRTWFAGSFLVSPFVHESAWRSGRRTAERLLAHAATPRVSFAAARRCASATGT